MLRAALLVNCVSMSINRTSTTITTSNSTSVNAPARRVNDGRSGSDGCGWGIIAING